MNLLQVRPLTLRSRTWMLAPFLALSLVACSTNRSAGEQFSDAAISSKIEAKLAADPQVSAFNVDVDTTAGVVRLSGVVKTSTARKEAAKLARDTDGVVRVINEIEIGERTLGERVDDSVITTKINAKLTGSGDINPFNIDVDSIQGKVTLSGTVVSEERKALAERLAREVKGVKKVDNRLEVKPE